jgi:hypothetical protein
MPNPPIKNLKSIRDKCQENRILENLRHLETIQKAYKTIQCRWTMVKTESVFLF